MVQSPLENVILAFPNLDQQKLQHTSSDTNRYNCIAWAAGDSDNWWEPDRFNYFYWPIRQRVYSLPCYQLAFQSKGFEPCGDSSLVPGIEKIALFCKGFKPTHAARQLNNGLWTSKLGEGIDVSHDLEGLQGDIYGNVTCFMQRQL